jgi:hypothetical protein
MEGQILEPKITRSVIGCKNKSLKISCHGPLSGEVFRLYMQLSEGIFILKNPTLGLVMEVKRGIS